MAFVAFAMRLNPKHLLWGGVIAAVIAIHVLNVRAAVSMARNGYVTEVELTAEVAARAELQRRLNIETAAKLRLDWAKTQAENRSAAYRQEVKNYAETVPEIGPCVMPNDLLDLLRH